MKRKIIIRMGGKLFRFGTVSIKSDGSFVFALNSDRFRIIAEDEVEWSPGEKKIKIKDIDNPLYWQPYFSFHPGKGTLHINATKDGEVVPLYADSDHISLIEMHLKGQYRYLFSLVIPAMRFVFNEHYGDIDSENNIVIDCIERRTMLQLEFIIHPSIGEIDIDSLVGAKDRKLIIPPEIIPLSNLSASLSIIASELPTKRLQKRIIAQFAQGKRNPVFFILEKVKNV